MKSQLLYAPLLLSLSVACGKAEKSAETQPSKVAISSQNTSLSFSPKSVAHAVSALNVSDAAKAQIKAVGEAQDAVAAGETIEAPVTNAPAVEAEAPAAEAPSVDGTPAPFAVTTTLSVGNPVVDSLCKKSFAATEALLFQGNQAAFDAIGLKATENALCMKQITSLTKKNLDDLFKLGRIFSFPITVKDAQGQVIQPSRRVTITAHREWDKYSTDIEAIQYLFAYVDYYSQDESLYMLAPALEDVRLVQQEISELTAIPADQLEAEQAERLIVLQARLPLVQQTAADVQARLNKYQSTVLAAELGYYVSIVDQYVNAPQQ